MFHPRDRGLAPRTGQGAKLALAAAALLTIACSGPRAPLKRNTTPHPSAKDGWRALAQGQVELAERRFAPLARSATPQGGLAGLLRVAHLRSDWARVSALLAQVAKLKTPLQANLAVSAAEAALAQPDKLGALQRRLATRACAAKGDRKLAVRAAGVCSRLAVRSKHPQLRRCVAGCGATPVNMPLSFVSNAPVVLASVAGQPPAPFIVDTGASVSVLTKAFVARAGLSPVPGSAFRINSPAGLLDAKRVVTKLRLGPLELEAVPFTVLALPLGGIAGIISPHGTLREFAVALDLRAQRLKVAKALPPEGGSAKLPLLLANGNPIVGVKLGQRPRRPLYLDTGAYRTSLTTALDRLGKPLQRVGRSRVAGAGGGTALAWITRARVPASAGDGLTWTVEDPVLFAKGDAGQYRDVEMAGLLGMEFLMGRVLLIDSPRRALHLSRRAQLPPWPAGSTQRLVVYGSQAPGGGATVDERLLSRKPDGSIVLEVTLTPKASGTGKGPRVRRMRLGMRDSWATRGGWLIARRAREAWVHDGKRFAKQKLQALTREWLRVFYGFASSGKNARITLTRLQRGTGELLCTETAVDARSKAGPARLHIWECPALPWRTVKIELRATKGQQVLWGFRHAELK
jgi:hypothetical protein